MNWQTKEVRRYIEDSKMCISTLNIQQLQESIESQLLIKCYSCQDYLKNLAITEFLKNVQWEELVYDPDAWDDWGN